MLWIDMPTAQDISLLNSIRADACVSIYLPTTPLTQHVGASQIAFRNAVTEASGQLQEAGLDKRRLAALLAPLDELADDDEFWRFQANSLAVLATPDSMRSFRLANKLSGIVEVSDRFLLKPLLRAVTFPHHAFVIAISENAVRLVEFAAELPPQAVKVPDLPRSAASAAGKSSLNDSAPMRRVQGAEGQNMRLIQYARKVDAALKPVLRAANAPLLIAATEPMASIFRSFCSAHTLLPGTIATSPDRMTEKELADAARPVLDAHYASEIAEFHKLYDVRKKQGRATSDIASAARAATFGAIQTILVDMDNVVPGKVDEESGAVTFAERAGADSYGVVDEIAGRALATHARVLAVRKSDLPERGDLAAILRYPV
ncbi:MAG: hypothetical protein H3C55_06885 [Pseudorhodoplanes sp.]|nr:hypothetical protein [Pseudorhodoplanes sp.]MBW7949061.1 hypothetical protein [Pseudorhodoplanes sp.]